MDKDEKFEKLKDILLLASGFSEFNIGSETRVYEDLGINGDDVDILLLSISENLGTDFSDFIFGDYFAGECSADMHYASLSKRYKNSKYRISKILDAPFLFLWWAFSSGKKYKTLTADDLYQAVQRGKW